MFKFIFTCLALCLMLSSLLMDTGFIENSYPAKAKLVFLEGLALMIIVYLIEILKEIKK